MASWYNFPILYSYKTLFRSYRNTHKWPRKSPDLNPLDLELQEYKKLKHIKNDNNIYKLKAKS